MASTREMIVKPLRIVDTSDIPLVINSTTGEVLYNEQTLFRRRAFYIPGKELIEVYIHEKTPEA